MKPTFALLLLATTASADLVDPKADVNALPTVPDGFALTVFAREPLVRQPCSMAFDSRGRLFLGTGPQYRNPTPDTPGDSVVIVEDTDGDGTADRTRVFATGFNTVQGLAWRGRDLWIANAPDLTLVRDTDGDDVADEYVKVFTDLGNLEHGLHGLVWAPDGKLYMSKGNSKGLNRPDHYAPKAFRDLLGLPAPAGAEDFPKPQVTRAADYKHAYHDPKDDWGLMGGVLRCDDGGKNLEIVSRGLRNPWDIAIDSGFNWLGTDNDQNGGDRVMMPFFGAHFGWNHPWSTHWTGEDHLPTVPISSPVFHGSGTGIVFGESPQFPPEYRGVFFINDWLRKTMYVFRPKWDGALMRVEGGEWQPFVVGGKALFRPTDVAFGPDGALWCLGWSRGYGAEMKDGAMTNEGRIYRIAWKEARPAAPLKPLGKMSAKELIAEFAGPIEARRVDAQDELVRRGAKAELLAALASEKLGESAETWAVWTLARISPDETFLAAKPADTRARLNLRVQCVRIAARAAKFPEVIRTLLADREPRLRFEAVQAIWQARQISLMPALIDVVAREEDRLTYYSAWRALRDLAGTSKLKEMLADARGGVRRAALLALLEDSALPPEEVKPLANDADAGTKELAEEWIKMTSGGGPSILVKGPGIDPSSRNPITGPAPAMTPPATPTTLDAALAAMSTADAKRGRLLALHPEGAGCLSCHHVAGRGNHFGPDLTGIGDRAEVKHLLQSLVEPSAVITEGFNTHVVETKRGTLSGVLLEESGMAVTLGLATGQRARVMRSEIATHDTLPTSAMPPFAAVLGPQQCADIAAWLMAQKATPVAARKTGQPKSAAGLAVQQTPDRLMITRDGEPFCDFVFRDEAVRRPFFSNIFAPGGVKVTRNFPPIQGQDATDHADMHPGIWLGFGDISGNDFWRNKATIRHEQFIEAPAVRNGRVTFASEGTLLDKNGAAMAKLENRCALTARADGVLVDWTATFTPSIDGFYFGDQEEMGFGVRIATPLTEKAGGEIVNHEGVKGAKQTWGKPAAWCDYSGVIDGRRVGIAIFPSPKNFRGSWWHNRDYGVFVANPFGRKAMKQGELSRVEVKRGESFTLRFGAFVHSTQGESRADVAAAYSAFCSTP